MWDLVVSVPDHCLSFYFDYQKIQQLVITVITGEISSHIPQFKQK